jgi:uncharacterized OsmC-like protein
MQTEIIRATEDLFRAKPEGAKSSPTVKARLADGRAELSAGAYTWHADLPPALGGTNTAPSPTAYLLGALAGCAIVFIHDTLGPQLGVRIDDVTAVARCTTDARGLLGLDGVAPDLGGIEVEISISSPDGSKRVDEVYRAWLERCPIYLAVTSPNAVETRLAVPAQS